MSSRYVESEVEAFTLEVLGELGYGVLGGEVIAPDGSAPERETLGEVVLVGRLHEAIGRLNPELPAATIDDVVRRVLADDGSSLIQRNRATHSMLVDGVPVEYRGREGDRVQAVARIVDFADPDANDWLAVNQFTVTGERGHRRPDVVTFLNGLPISVVELKNASDENATVEKAHRQLQTYKREIPGLFVPNGVLVVSDGFTARVGSLTANFGRFGPWRTIDGETEASGVSQLEVLLRGLFDRARFLEYLRHFVAFEEESEGLVKKIAGYHQFHAVLAAVEETLRASDRFASGDGRHRKDAARRGGDVGDRRVGVVWHTQGSGKSLTMLFYAGKLAMNEAMENPTVVVLTDRNDLDEQLFQTFSRCASVLRQTPVQAESRGDLREKLRVESGGVIFTTIQKFTPDSGAKGDRELVLTDRRNVIVVADEAHRSQYDFIDGYARAIRDALPRASFIGFTGTPIEKADANTRAVFGDYISVYDIQQAVEDGATVPIYYEGRLVKLQLDGGEVPDIDLSFDEATEGEELERKEKLKSRWAQLEALVGAERRIEEVAEDLVRHFEQRTEVLEGKAMAVCMSRRICVDLYEAIRRLRPDWHGEGDANGAMKIIMTGSASDPEEWAPHIRSKAARKQLAVRFRDPKDSFRLVIVRDMWLTGFDAPCLHTMYVDKPMRDQGLMQAIARVNRVFRDKPGGLVVDYLGLADELKEALGTYTESGGKGDPKLDQSVAVRVMEEKYEVCLGLFHGFDWSAWTRGTAVERNRLLTQGAEHLLAQEDGKSRSLQAISELTRAFTLSVPHERTIEIRDDLDYFQTVRAALAKGEPGERPSTGDLDAAIRQIVSKAVAPGEIVDIFAAAGLDQPNIAILSDEFLEEVRGLPQKNLAIEMLRRLLLGEIRKRSKKNVVQARSFKELLEQAIRKYQNRSIETAQVISELIDLAKELKAAQHRGEQLGLSEDELAFYEALGANESAVAVLGDDTLCSIARELVREIRKNVTIDWTVREAVRARLRVLVKRILRRSGYPPDRQERAVETVLEQAEALSAEWAA